MLYSSFFLFVELLIKCIVHQENVLSHHVISWALLSLSLCYKKSDSLGQPWVDVPAYYLGLFPFRRKEKKIQSNRDLLIKSNKFYCFKPRGTLAWKLGTGVVRSGNIQSNFLSTVILNFDYVFFFGIYCHFVEICLLHWVSATKESMSMSQKRSKNTFFVTNQQLLCRTDSVRRTSSKEIAKNAKKGDMVKIENHCIKKIRFGYLIHET